MWRLAVVFLGASLLLGCAETDPPDLAACLESIRDQGMSEMARSQLIDISGMVLGHHTLEYIEDPESGRFWQRFTSNLCPLPGTDPEELASLQKTRTAESDSLIALLRPLADSDESGFVSTAEALEMNETYRFGLLLRAVGAKQPVTVDALCVAAGLSREVVQARISAHELMSARAREAGLQGLGASELNCLSN